MLLPSNCGQSAARQVAPNPPGNALWSNDPYRSKGAGTKFPSGIWLWQLVHGMPGAAPGKGLAWLAVLVNLPLTHDSFTASPHGRAVSESVGVAGSLWVGPLGARDRLAGLTYNLVLTAATLMERPAKIKPFIGCGVIG